MANSRELTNCVRALREQHGWSQEELARRSGLSRAGISAIEMGRLVPSTAAALALADTMSCRVEDLFQFSGAHPEDRLTSWAWSPTRLPCRFWRAEVFGRILLYPVEPSPLGLVGHDGVLENAVPREIQPVDPRRTLLLACCDPAVGLLAEELARLAEVRLIVIPRSSRAALTLLRQGLVHMAGLHLCRADRPAGNVGVVQSLLGDGFSLLRLARWEEGIALASTQKIATVRSALQARLRWVGREEGSGARQCLDELRGNRPAPRHLAEDHRGVASAIRSGFADAGICLRLASEEAGLNFLSVRQEAYDLCVPNALREDPRFIKLWEVVQSKRYRQLLGTLPGYDSRETGDWCSISV